MQKKRVLYLDLIRIICFLLVTSFHFAYAVKNFGIDASVDFYLSIFGIGWGTIAVSCFFMVSGAALIYHYKDNFSLKEFYKKRFFGLYPLFWLAYLFGFLEYFYHSKSIGGAPKINFLLSIIGMDGYLSQWIPTYYIVGEWFLGMLIMLYLLFPVYRVVMCRCKYILPVTLFIASIVLIYYNPFPMMFDKNPIVCSMYFVLGMLIEMLRESSRRVVRVSRKIAAAVGVGVVLLVIVYHTMTGRIPSLSARYCVRIIFPIVLYLIVMEAAEWVKSEKVKRLVAMIGKHSYAYFLVHHVFLQRYIQNFAGIAMNRTNTLLLFASSVVYIYALAVGLDKIYAAFVQAIRKWRDIGKE